jgi:hypothetical protein
MEESIAVSQQLSPQLLCTMALHGATMDCYDLVMWAAVCHAIIGIASVKASSIRGVVL